MVLRIVDYKRDMDEQLLNLFYQSIFYKKKEFEYVRVPNKWIYRYEISRDYVTKIAILNDEIIASLGALIRTGRVDNKVVKIGCFVDNCILPKYLERYDEIFYKLFTEVENELKKREVGVICGWDFLKKVNEHRLFFKKLGFIWVDGINWYPGGFDFKGDYPIPWKSEIDLKWKILFKFITYYHKIKEKIISDLPRGVELRVMSNSDFKNVYELINLNFKYAEFAPGESLGDFKDRTEKNYISGIVAEKDSEIIGALTFITSAWSGWMFGKPCYNKNWQTFFTFTPDDFVVKPEYQNTSVPANMILRLLKLKKPNGKVLKEKSYGFIADVFDRRISWRRRALLKTGCMEPKADYGAILAKSLNKDIKLDKSKIWYLPARYILAPVPSTEELQGLNRRHR